MMNDNMYMTTRGDNMNATYIDEYDEEHRVEYLGQVNDRAVIMLDGERGTCDPHLVEIDE
jgi:hypothetical protein